MLGLVLAGLNFPFLLADLSVGEINFIANQHLDCVWGLMFFEHFVPDFEVIEGGLLGDVVDHDGAVGVLHVVGDETAEAFLAGGVPELYAVLSAVAGDVLDVEVDSDGGLHGGKTTLRPS
jgi:hypothetical protein